MDRTTSRCHGDIASEWNIRNDHFPGHPVNESTLICAVSQSTRNQESAVRPDHRGSGRKDLVQGDPSQRGPEQNVWSPEQNVRSSVLRHDDISHLEECCNNRHSVFQDQVTRICNVRAKRKLATSLIQWHSIYELEEWPTKTNLPSDSHNIHQ